MKKVSDKYINKLVLNFNDNDFVKDVIKKTLDIDNYRDVKITDNSIKCFARNYSKEIIIDEKNHTITTIHSGKKENDNQTTYFKNEVFYKETDDRYVITKSNSQADAEIKNDTTHLNTTNHNSIDEYLNNRRVCYSSAKKESKYFKQNNEEYRLIDQKITKKDFYRLANGDVLRIVNIDGVEKYYYCDSSVMKTKDNIDANKQKFNVEISNKDASSILKNLNDSYELLNDNFIYI